MKHAFEHRCFFKLVRVFHFGERALFNGELRTDDVNWCANDRISTIMKLKLINSIF